jgi:hypothetical protein
VSTLACAPACQSFLVDCRQDLRLLKGRHANPVASDF